MSLPPFTRTVLLPHLNPKPKMPNHSKRTTPCGMVTGVREAEDTTFACPTTPSWLLKRQQGRPEGIGLTHVPSQMSRPEVRPCCGPKREHVL